MTDRGWRKILKGDVTPPETVARIGEAAASYRARSGIAPQAERGKSWMLPEAKSEKLVYVAAGEVYVYAYGTNKLVGTLSRIGGTLYECSDKHGDVSVAVPGGASQPGVYEYAHGGTEPINYFSVAGAVACAVDPSSGNLAITNGGPTVYIYQNASGLPEAYTDDDEYTTDVAYDDSGNLFVDGFSETTSFLLSETTCKRWLFRKYYGRWQRRRQRRESNILGWSVSRSWVVSICEAPPFISRSSPATGDFGNDCNHCRLHTFRNPSRTVTCAVLD